MTFADKHTRVGIRIGLAVLLLAGSVAVARDRTLLRAFWHTSINGWTGTETPAWFLLSIDESDTIPKPMGRAYSSSSASQSITLQGQPGSGWRYFSPNQLSETGLMQRWPVSQPWTFHQIDGLNSSEIVVSPVVSQAAFSDGQPRLLDPSALLDIQPGQVLELGTPAWSSTGVNARSTWINISNTRGGPRLIDQGYGRPTSRSWSLDTAVLEPGQDYVLELTYSSRQVSATNPAEWGPLLAETGFDRRARYTFTTATEPKESGRVLLVVDEVNGGIVYRLDETTGKFVRFTSETLPGSRYLEMDLPHALYVGQEGTKAVGKLDMITGLLSVVTAPTNDVAGPGDISVLPTGNVLVASGAGDTIDEYDPDTWTKLRTWPFSGTVVSFFVDGDDLVVGRYFTETLERYSVSDETQQPSAIVSNRTDLMSRVFLVRRHNSGDILVGGPCLGCNDPVLRFNRVTGQYVGPFGVQAGDGGGADDLRVDPVDGTVWLARDGSVFKLAADGSVLAEYQQDGVVPDTLAIQYTEPICAADVTTSNRNPGEPGYGLPDGQVDGADLSRFVEAWLIGLPVSDVSTLNTNPGDAGYGVPDGLSGGNDLSYFVEAWLAGCS